MAEEINEIFEHIGNGNNFLLSGGAGSGKTYSLVEVVKGIYEQNPLARIACITYTNVAVNEIRERLPFQHLRVSTIHDFLWDVIAPYQLDLKKSLVHLLTEKVIPNSDESLLNVDFFKEHKIAYREWKKLKAGVISHDEVISIAEHMFRENKLLSDILKDKFDFILIDEYQDTFQSIIQILLVHLQKSNKLNTVGFFGDSMQSIYPSTVGDIADFINDETVNEVIKKDNRRNPKQVIDLINKIRNDGLQQEQSEDEKSPNFGKDGSIKFLYSTADSYDIDQIKQLDYFQNFDFENNEKTKELYLVHNLIADKAGFLNLMNIYDKDGIIKYKNRIRKEIKDKGLEIDESKTFGEIINEVGKAPTPAMRTFVENNNELYEVAKTYPYEIFKNIYLDKDQLIGDKQNSEIQRKRKGEKRDALISHLFHIQECIFLYTTNRYNEFIKKTNYSLTSIASKIELKKIIDELVSMGDASIEDVIEFAHENGIWRKDDKFYHFLEQKEYVFNRVKEENFQEFVNLYNYMEDFSPYSTQHSIKGAEFDNVFVILDNGKWSQYNFEYLFENREDKESVLERTRKIFYVCCSRAKENLVVYYHNPTELVLEKATSWFGEENVHDIT